MSPTTLITFRVRAPRSTRTLELYGSWDNFTRGYPMSKDLQVGSEYWSGCFNFGSIICDGRPSETMKPREGGLRMGGTYWYHYKINDEIDFHNVCERATTNCPMLPGQLINVLNVPYAFSGNRSRNPSTSSTSSERRTMNPEDKFMNPRPAPAKPEKARMTTSPTLNTFGDAGDANMQAKEDPKHLRLAKKPSLDSFAVPAQQAAVIGDGIRAAFRLRTARSQSPEAKNGLDVPSHRRAASVERPVLLRKGSEERVGRSPQNLLLRSTSEESIPTMSFGEHRRQRSTSREGSSLRHVVSIERLKAVEALALVKSNHHPLSTLKEVASTSNTPVEGPTSEEALARQELDLEKRLPTLPNTPSSAYPPSMMGGSPERHALDLAQLESHFSATTIDTDYQPISVAFPEESRFSAWTTSTTDSCVFVDKSIPLPARNLLAEFEARADSPTIDLEVPSSTSLASMCSSISSTPSSSFIDTDAEFEAAQSKMVQPSAPSRFQHYKLPEDDFASSLTLKAPSEEIMRGRTGHRAFAQAETNHDLPEIVHSESMLKLLDELSYLSDMIQQ